MSFVLQTKGNIMKLYSEGSWRVLEGFGERVLEVVGGFNIFVYSLHF